MIRVATWKPRLDGAATEAALLALVQEYSNTWLPSDVARLPIACQQSFPESAEDIARLAVTFKQEELKFSGPEDVTWLLHELAGVFGIAAERLRSLRSPWRWLET